MSKYWGDFRDDLPPILKGVQPFDFSAAALSKPWVPPSQPIYDLVRAIQEAEADRLDALVMEMLADPRRPGIAVIEQDAVVDLERCSIVQHTLMALDTRVPDGHIFRFQGQSSYDAWVESGCPVE